MTSQAKAWLCDLDGTLYHPRAVKLFMAAELALLGARQVKVITKFREAHESLREEVRMDPSRSFAPSPFDEQLCRTAEATGRSPEEVKAVVWQWMVERPGKWLRRHQRKSLIDEIRSFQQSGGRTALVSDYPASPKLKAMGLSELFDVVVASGESEGLGRLKPSPDSFLLAAKRLEIAPANCLVIGDRQDADGDAARAAGMQFRLIH